MRVGVLGGTFDPPHLGHLGLSINVLREALVDEVWFVPCLTHRFGKAPAPFDARLEMCRLLIAGRHSMRVSNIEETLRRPGYTLDLIETLMIDYPEHTFRLIAGQDIYHQKEKWHHYDDVAALAPPIYVARVGEQPIPGPLVAAPIDVSSTEVKERLERGRSVDGLLAPAVIRYIETHNLYRTNDHD